MSLPFHARRQILYGGARLIFALAIGWAAGIASGVPLTNDWVRWELDIGTSCDSSPAIGADGTIYFGAFDGNFWAVNPNGTRQWIFRTGVEIRSAPALATDGTIYFGCRDRKLHALNPQGTELWNFKTGAWVDSSPALARKGDVYFGSWDKHLYALSQTGNQLWRFATEGPVVSSPAIGTNGTIYFGSHDGKFYALAADGTKQWNFKTAGPILSSPALDDSGVIYFTSADGFLYALNDDGRLRWKLHTASDREGSPVIGLNGLILLASGDALWAVTPEGKQKWLRGKDDMDATPAVAADGAIIFAYRHGEVLNYDHERQLRWRRYLFVCDAASPAIGKSGTIYLPGAWLKLFALQGDSPLASTPWPKFRGNARNTGNLADSPR